jgi:hypothetical protein
MTNPNRARAGLPSGGRLPWNQNGRARQVDGVHAPSSTVRETPYVARGGAPPLRGALPHRGFVSRGGPPTRGFGGRGVGGRGFGGRVHGSYATPLHS